MPHAMQCGKRRNRGGSHAVALKRRAFSAKRNGWVINADAPEYLSARAKVGSCVNIDSKGHRQPLEFRLTMGLRKIDGRWRIMHEHHSLPAVE
jgi:hypothetical protein